MSVLHMLLLREAVPPMGVHRYDANPNITSIKAVLLHRELGSWSKTWTTCPSRSAAAGSAAQTQVLIHQSSAVCVAV